MKKSFGKILKGFTLAEIMIVLTIIGVLAGILVPIAVHSRPDDKVMKFKKADATLKNAIRELVNSDQYYVDGYLGTRRLSNGMSQAIDGSHEGDYTYFCNSLADILTTKEVYCKKVGHVGFILMSGETGDYSEDRQKYLDQICTGFYTTTALPQRIVTPDGITYFYLGDQMLFTDDRKTNVDENGFQGFYTVMCVDIDKMFQGEAPFAYGIRADGKILAGKRATEWMEKEFQKGKNDN